MSNISKPIGKRNRLVSKEEAKAMLERIVVKEIEKIEKNTQSINKDCSQTGDIIGLNESYMFYNDKGILFYDVDFAPLGFYLVACNRGGNLIVLQPSSMGVMDKVIDKKVGENLWSVAMRKQDFESSIYAVDTSLNRIIYSDFDYTTKKITSKRKGRPKKLKPTCLAFAQNNFAAIGYHEGFIDYRTCVLEERRIFRKEIDYVPHSLSFSIDDNFLFVGDGDNNALVVYEIDCAQDKLKQICRIPHPNSVFGVDVSPCGKYVATGCLDGHLRIFKNQGSFSGPKPEQSFENVINFDIGNDNKVYGVAFKSCGTKIAIAIGLGVRVYGLERKK